MWKAKTIKGKWQLVYHTNNSLYRGWNILPNINIGYLKTKFKYSYETLFWISFDWFSFSISVRKQK